MDLPSRLRTDTYGSVSFTSSTHSLDDNNNRWSSCDN
jgi:hypothetical protein